MKKIEIKTRDGIADVYVFQPEEQGKWPAVLFYMDGFGVRPDLFKMAERLASNGYYVVLPNLYHRWDIKEPIRIEDIMKEGPARDKLFAMVSELTPEKVMSDTNALLEFIEKQDQVKKGSVASVGYCMGGKFALAAAATFPDTVKAAASYHGGSLATTRPESVHLLVPHIKGNIYIGVAEQDHNFSIEEKELLIKSLEDAHVHYTLEVYEGARHGFAVYGHPVYNEEASEKHWKTLLDLLEKKL